MDIPLPSRAALKAQAKRLRLALADAGTQVTYAQALETVAHQWGARDWNTLVARTQTPPQNRFGPGQRISGQYLGHRFQGVVKAARQMAQGRHAVTIRFDKAIDVVTSAHFSSLRRQVNCVLEADGRTRHTTSDGQPHMVIYDHWSGQSRTT